MSPLAREVHPAAWWAWALGLAAAASTTTNPLVLGTVLGVVCLVVAARRGSSPWARSFRLYLCLGAAIVAVRVVLHVLVGVKSGDVVLLPLPSVTLPSWAAGVELLGPVRLEGLLATALEGARLAVMIACVGAANALANPKRLLRALPAALNEIGTAVVVAVTVAPQLAESVQRVRRARRLRGEPARGVRGLREVALPVLQDTLDRALLLAAAMDSRGYGRRDGVTPRSRRITGGLTLTGLLGTAVGCYGLLDTTSPAVLGLPVLLVGLALAAAGVVAAGRGVRRSVHRPDPWALPEWITSASGALAAAVLLATARTDPEALAAPLYPLGLPVLPVVPVLALLLAALPAAATPPPPPAPARGAAGRRVRTRPAPRARVVSR